MHITIPDQKKSPPYAVGLWETLLRGIPEGNLPTVRNGFFGMRVIHHTMHVLYLHPKTRIKATKLTLVVLDNATLAFFIPTEVLVEKLVEKPQATQCFEPLRIR